MLDRMFSTARDHGPDLSCGRGPQLFDSSLFLGLSLAGWRACTPRWEPTSFGAQIVVYVSGIAVLVMFVVMLLGRLDLHLRQVNEHWIAALLICSVAAVGLFKVTRLHSATIATGATRPGTHEIDACSWAVAAPLN